MVIRKQNAHIFIIAIGLNWKLRFSYSRKAFGPCEETVNQKCVSMPRHRSKEQWENNPLSRINREDARSAKKFGNVRGGHA